MIITTNIDAMKALRSLGINNNENNKSLEKLSSGMRINRAADDSAGLAISTKMRAQIRGLDKAAQNIEDGLSLFRVGDGALNEVDAMLMRIKEIAVQAANDTNTDEDREKLDLELSSLLDEIDSIADETEFNTIKIFKPNFVVKISGLVSGRGINSPEAKVAADNLDSANPLTGDRDGFFFTGLDGVSRTYLFELGEYLPAGFIDVVKNMYSNDPVIKQNSEQAFIDGLIKAMNDGLAASAGQHPSVPAPMVTGVITPDGKVVIGTTTGEIFTEMQCPGQTGSGSTNGFLHRYLHAGLNYYSGSTTIGDFESSVHAMWIQMGPNRSDGATFIWNSMSVKELGMEFSKLTPREEAEKTLADLEVALSFVTEIRTCFGSYMNRLEHAGESVGITGENMSASESRVRDVNMSKEMVEQIKTNILTQSATAMLAQANKRPEGVLQLLR